MNIISKKSLVDFCRIHPTAESGLMYWYKIAKKSEWKNLVEVKQDFPHADLAGICTIFNISGNNFRLITKIYYPNKVILIRFILTHAEYDKKVYKNDCEC